SVGTLLAGYAIGYLFVIVSPTPSGIGFVEGAMTLALTTLRVPLAAATVITLAFRGITVWLTLLYGMVAMRWIGKQPSAPGPAQPSS
ncbi:MAG: lysylphosphatidylglycerol synthase domain-containing protein, partial [Chloroflexi bacterium]|nr:lysylphosphatidylglycerol synthase domain-containing protein [Chloroflexota bacterium]